MSNTIRYENRDFFKSSASHKDHMCVGVSIGKNDVAVINTNTRDKIMTFSHDEWKAFIIGAKKGEFDLEV